MKCEKEVTNLEDEKETVFIKNYQKGEIFGELALFYNTPRASSIISLTDCVLYKLDW